MSTLVRVLAAADVPAAMRIKEAAGWNQTETDWRNLLRLAPDTCFALECDGALAATTTAVCYQRRLAWIGMVLTDPVYRRRGFARRLMEHAIDALVARGVEWIKLDATEMGAPLYRQLGFEDEAPVERWRTQAAGESPALSAMWPAEGMEVDRQAFGPDRSGLLAVLAGTGVAVIPGEGYAMTRPGSQAAYFGPCVSRRPDTARALLAWSMARHAGQSVYWDLLPLNTAAARLAREWGFQPVRRLVRMVRPGVSGAPLVHDDSMVYAIAGFEYG